MSNDGIELLIENSAIPTAVIRQNYRVIGQSTGLISQNHRVIRQSTGLISQNSKIIRTRLNVGKRKVR